MNIQVGDWVRYHIDGVLHIGVVEYIKEQRERYPYTPLIYLSCGVIVESEVLEVRRVTGA